MSYAELGDVLVTNLAIFLFEPRTTLLGQFLHLAGWFAGLSLGLTRFFRNLFQTTHRNVWQGATVTGATVLAISLLFINYLFPASQFFGLAGAMVALMLWVSCAMVIVAGGAYLTYKMLERRGIQTEITEFVMRLESAAAPPSPEGNHPQR